jgi:hypothetical protein
MARATIRVLAHSLALAACLCFGCSDDDGGGGKSDEPQGEACDPNGPPTMTGCMCLNGGIGARHCTDGVWSECVCAPVLQPGECEFDGQKVICSPSGSCTEEWEVECFSNTFDCTCPADQNGAGNGGGGAGGRSGNGGNGGDGGSAGMADAGGAGSGGSEPDAGDGNADMDAG